MIKKNILMVCVLTLLLSGGVALNEKESYDTMDPARYKFHPLSAESSYQIILDVEDPCFEIFSGNWTLTKTGSYNWNYYYVINGPGTGSGAARWIAEGLPQGRYLIEFYADNGNYAADARYQVISSDGIHNLTVNMNYIAGGWHSLGTFDINRTCVVNISDYWTGVGTKLSVDALQFTLQTALPPTPSSPIPPHIGLCIDDCGSVDPTNASQPIYKMLHLPFKMTFAVMPFRSYTNQTAEEIFSHGSEVILHQPMAAITVPDPGAGGITDSMTLSQVRSTISANLDGLPHVVGMNNHMGSLITQQQDKMQVCMEELKTRNLYFYDSRTITVSVGYDLAKQNGLLTGERDLFLDGSTKEQAKALICILALRALHAPLVPNLGIGHVRTDTADALVEMASELSAMGVEVWPLSKCLAQVIESDSTPNGASFMTQGNWSTSPNDRFSKELHDNACKIVYDPGSTHADKAVFTPCLPVSGKYDIFTAWTPDDACTSQSQILVTHAYGTKYVAFDQSLPFYDWFYIGRYSCNAGTSCTLQFLDSACTIPSKIFPVDAVKYVYIEPLGSSSCQLWAMY